MKTILALAALLAAAPALAQQSARTQPEPGYIPGPPASVPVNPAPTAFWGTAYGEGANPANGNTAQGLGAPGFGSDMPAGTRFGPSPLAGLYAQPTSDQGRLYRTDISNNNVYPYRQINPNVIGPQAPHKLPRALVEPLPPDYATPSPPPRGGTNIQRGAPQGDNPATNASPSGLSPERELPTTGQPARASQMLSPSPVVQPTP